MGARSHMGIAFVVWRRWTSLPRPFCLVLGAVRQRRSPRASSQTKSSHRLDIVPHANLGQAKDRVPFLGMGAQLGVEVRLALLSSILLWPLALPAKLSLIGTFQAHRRLLICLAASCSGVCDPACGALHSAACGVMFCVWCCVVTVPFLESRTVPTHSSFPAGICELRWAPGAKAGSIDAVNSGEVPEQTGKTLLCVAVGRSGPHAARELA